MNNAGTAPSALIRETNDGLTCVQCVILGRALGRGATPDVRAVGFVGGWLHVIKQPTNGARGSTGRLAVADATGASRLEELAGQLSALSGDVSHVRENQVKGRDIETLREAISDMRQTMAQNQQPQHDGGAMIGLSRQIEALSSRIDALPSLKSRQWELGFKQAGEDMSWQLAYFNILRPVSNLDACNRLGISPCLGAYDGEAVHQGLEASGQWVSGPWALTGGLTLINARRQGSIAEPTTNGARPTNVPDWIARAQASYRVAALPGLQLSAGLSQEGGRAVLPDQSITLPAWTRIDAGLRYATTLGGYKTDWTLGIDNLFDKRFFRESPYQFGHVYLFPAAPRTVRVAMQASL